ncbi:MAG: NnrS family protein [Candidatus Binatia bacterium]
MTTPVPAANAAILAAPFWRREPYAVFFPLGVVLSWAGVGRWLEIALTGRHEDYLAIYIFHGMTQIQGFLLCFAIGFLFTMIPRRTGTAPPSALEMTIGLVAPVATVLAAWGQRWALSQVGWMVACVLLVVFVGRRFASSSARRRPPTGFVWIPVALVIGFVGSALTGARGALGTDWMWLHDLGQQLVLQGVFIALVLGVGSLALPMMTRGISPADAEFTRRDMAVIAAHLGAAGLLVASFVIQSQWSLPIGCALRAVVIAAVLLLGAELWRPPSIPGWNRRVVWLSAWMLPTGFAFAALYPAYYQAGLHISFVAGLATLTLAVSTHVVLGHGDRSDLINGQPWQVGTIAMLMAAATLCRVAMTMQPLHRNAWMATAAFFFLAATVVWALFLVPVLLRRRD